MFLNDLILLKGNYKKRKRKFYLMTLESAENIKI